MAMANKATLRKLLALPKRVGLKFVAELIAAPHETEGNAKRIGCYFVRFLCISSKHRTNR